MDQPCSVPAPDAAGRDGGAGFRVEPAAERLRLLARLRDAEVPIVVGGPGGTSVATTLWAIDEARQRLSFDAGTASPCWDELVEADEAVAVAWLDSVKLQFDLQGLLRVYGERGAALSAALPQDLYRFQRRHAFRVQPTAATAARALLRHPAIPEMQLSLRLLDLSSGGCALWLPAEVPPLQAGTEIGAVTLELDGQTRLTTAVVLLHVSASGGSDRADAGLRLGCEWRGLPGGAERTLQRWIDQAQKRRRLLAGG